MLPKRLRRAVFVKIKNIIFDAERGEKLCSNCGIVLAEGVETEDLGLDTKDRIDTTLHNGISSSLMTYDKGLSTVIPFANTDGNGAALLFVSLVAKALTNIWL